MRNTILRCAVLACLMSALAVSAYANPAPDPSAFTPFVVSGIDTSPTDFASGQLAYMLTINSGAYMLSEGHQYPIVSVWGFFAVDKTDDSANNFAASGPDLGEWGWDQHPIHGGLLTVGGWLDTKKKEAILTPASGSASKSFAFTQLSFTGSAPLVGLHVSVSIPAGLQSPFPGGGVTSAIIPTPVPEPSSITALFAGVAGLSGLRRRGRRRSPCARSCG